MSDDGVGFEANIWGHEETFNQFAYLYMKLVELGEKVDVDLRRKFCFWKDKDERRRWGGEAKSYG